MKEEERILRNSAICLDCNDEIISKFTHDFVTCKCGNLSVDGGSSYLKRNYNNIDSYKEISVYDDGIHDTRRQNMRWGVNYDKDMNRLPNGTEWRLIKDLVTEHIQAILSGGYADNNSFYKGVFEEELKFRNNVSS